MGYQCSKAVAEKKWEIILQRQVREEGNGYGEISG